MDARNTLAAAALGLVAGLPSGVVAGEDHNHGAPVAPAMGLEDIAARASTTGGHFQLVARPKDGRLVIFIDHAETNTPAAGARVEILAGDALVTVEERAPGLYVVAPWPMEGLPADEAENIELVATVVHDRHEEVLLARMSAVAGDDHAGHDHDAEPGRSEDGRIALWDAALPTTAGAVAILGAVTGLRSTGRRRWARLAVCGAGIVTVIAATGLA